MRKYRLRVGLDVDDTLYDCNSYALSIINAQNPQNEPITLNEIKGWGTTGKGYAERTKLYADPEFVKTQPIFNGAQKFVKELSKIADVFFVTAVPPQCMTARAERLRLDFPEIPQENIIMGTRKDVISLDILLDDGAHNISNSRAAYPVLFRKPWNVNLSGLLSVNSYDDFLHFCKMVKSSFAETTPNLLKGGVICLVGPTGSGKNEIANILKKDKRFAKAKTTTTRPKNEGESNDAYSFVNENDFLYEKERGAFLETTVYGGYHFGTSRNEIDRIVNEGKCAVMPIDICGALTIKNHYKTKAITVFLNRDKDEVISDIIGRNIPNDDKVKRIVALDYEYRNNEICDTEIYVQGNLNDVADEIIKLIYGGIKK